MTNSYPREVAREAAALAAARGIDLGGSDAISAILTSDPALTAREVCDCLAEATAEAKAEEERLECGGHPAGAFDRMGETVYCDGTCRKGVRQ